MSDAAASSQFLALTIDDPLRRTGLTLHFVNDSDDVFSLRVRAQAIVDMPSGPRMTRKIGDEPPWRSMGLVGPRSAAVLATELAPAAGVVILWTLELTAGDDARRLSVTEYRDAPQTTPPRALPVLDREGWLFAAE